jgi:ABC-type Fe3+-hydroxamate transport system substrate-binding protein
MATLEVLGFGCRSCSSLLKNAVEAIRQARRGDTVTKVTDYDRIVALDPWALPALAIDGKVVVAGRIATPAELRALLEDEPTALDPQTPTKNVGVKTKISAGPNSS